MWYKHCSIQFSHSVVSNSLWPHGLQHARLPYPSPTPGACSYLSSSSRWYHPTISSSGLSFSSSCLQSFPASGSFPRNQFFASGGQPRWSFSFSISPSNEHSGLISMTIRQRCVPKSWDTLNQEPWDRSRNGSYHHSQSSIWGIFASFPCNPIVIDPSAL